MDDKIYIIILNWNNWQDTIACLETVFSNTYPNFQVIVCDNASSDDSLDFIKRWADGNIQAGADNTHNSFINIEKSVRKPIPYVEYNRSQAEQGGCQSKDDRSLILIQTGDNLGFAGGNNVALRFVLNKKDATYVWLLNNDTVIDKDALSNMALTAKRNQVDLVGSKLIYFYSGEIQTIGGLNNLSWKRFGEVILPTVDKPYTSDFYIDGYICGASLLISANVLNDIGLLDENYFMWAEETDYCLRAKREGYKMMCSINSVIYHKEGGSCGKSEAQIKFGRKSYRVSLKRFVITGYYDTRNSIYFVRKHMTRAQYYRFIGLKAIEIIRRSIGIIAFNDDNKTKRISLLFKGLTDGILNKMGRTINPQFYSS